MFLDLFKLKFDNKWLPMYELAKVSLNNRGNEIKFLERRSQEGVPLNTLNNGNDENIDRSNSDAWYQKLQLREMRN